MEDGERSVANDPSRADQSIPLWAQRNKSAEMLYKKVTSDPTPEVWEEELNMILDRSDGGTEYIINHLGDAGERIEQLIFYLDDPDKQEKSRAFAQEAFDRLLEKWDPDAPIEPKKLWYLLSIATRFLPSRGISRFLKLLNNPQNLDQKIEGLPGVNLWNEDIWVINKYFKQDPKLKDTPEYAEYQSMLEKMVQGSDNNKIDLARYALKDLDGEDIILDS